ncbi:MAG: hypothetical protein DHS20C18_22710 [Saprospiraceae bacterium]|nr:MAG: hypothetical protein DHS20C18_22710 [Saprospiraceae bacterium]
MSIENSFQNVKKLILPYLEDDSLADSIEMDSDFIKDLKINSVHIVDFVIDLENAYDIVVDDDTLSKLSTVREVIDILEARKPVI